MLILSEKKNLNQSTNKETKQQQKKNLNQSTNKETKQQKKKTRKHYGTYTNVRLVNWTEIEFLKILD